MGFYDDMQELATDLLTEFNQGTVQYEEIIPANGPWDDPGQPTSKLHDIPGAVTRAAEFRYIDNTSIFSTTTQVTFNVIPDLVIDDLDVLVLDGDRRTVIRFMQIPETGTPVVYKVFVKD